MKAHNRFKAWTYTLLLTVVILGLVFTFNCERNRIEAASVARIAWLNNTTLWPLGVNLAWYNWDNDFSDNGWTARFAAIKAQFDTMASQGVRAVRWWVFPDGNVAPLWSGTGEGSLCTGLPDKWVEHMVEMADYAKSKDMRIYFCFTSFDWGYNDHAWNHDDIFDNATVRKSFLEKAVKPILQALGTHEGIMGWDVINEPEWLIATADGGSPNEKCESFSLASMREFAKDVVDYVHTYAKQPVSVGSASMKWCGGQYQFWTGLGLDFYDFHWYDWATPWFNPLKTSPVALGLDKPCIIGEMMPNPQSSSLSMTHEQILEALYANGYAGYMPWAWNDNANDCKPYIHPGFNNFVAAHPDVNKVLPNGSQPTGTLVPTPTVSSTVAPTLTPSPTNTVVVSPTPTQTTMVSPTPTTASGCSVAYQIQGDWGSGATVNIIIKNNSNVAINGWTLAWSFGGNQKVANLWNGTFTQSGTAVTVKNMSYNAIIPANGTVSFGFNISYSGSNVKPTGFILNGTACQVQ
ncbi:MAG TPA: cellulose binding domain-containing protein [Bacillota bacterium]|nr:cellulose binding domain-containing protein [Bacillota bacterium]